MVYGQRCILLVLLGWVLVLRPALGAEEHQAIDDATRIYNEVERLDAAGQYAAAVPLCERELARQRAAPEPRHAEVARWLNKLGSLYWRMGQHGKAEPAYLEALALGRRTLGPRHAEVAQSLHGLGTLYSNMGRYAKAEPLLQDALAMRKDVLGPRHLDVAKSLNNLGILYNSMGRHDQAESVYQQALALRRELLGPRHKDVAMLLHNLGNVNSNIGKYVEAELLFEQALAIYRAVLGPSHPFIANATNSLALLHVRTGEYGKAEGLYRQALAMNKAAHGQRHPSVAMSLNNLGDVLAHRALYGQAEPLFQEALAIWKEVLGPRHTNVAVALHNLADLYWDTGQYARAESLHQEALAMRQELLDPQHPELALSQRHLGQLYAGIGQYARAEPLYLAALATRRATLGPRHPDVADVLNHLANLYRKMGQCDRAAPLQKEALAIRREALRPGHPDLAKSLNNLGQIESCLGRPDAAEPLYREALAIRRKALGPRHPEVAHTLNHLANLYKDLGQYDRAEPLYAEALAIRQEILGPRHPDAARLLHEQAVLKLARGGPPDDALPLLQRGLAIDEGLLETIVSESRLGPLLQTLRAREDDVYSLLARHPDVPAVQQLALTVALLRKGRSAAEGQQTQRAIQQALSDPQDRALFDRLTATRSRLAGLYYKDSAGMPEYRQALAALEREADDLEMQLARRAEAFRSLQLPDPAAVRGRVAGALPRDAALIEWLVFTPRRPSATQAEPRREAPRYLALVLLPDQRVSVVDLGEAGPIDAAVAALQDRLGPRLPDALPAAQRLHQLVMAPLREALEGRTHLLVSPDGALNLVPLWALHDGARYLLDDYQITYLTAGRDLLRPSAAAPAALSLAVLASPDYRPAAARGVPTEALASAGSGTSRSLFAGQLQRVPLLPGTQTEAQAIHRLFPQARILLGRDASERALRGLAAPTVLHVATHGLFLDDGEAAAGGRARSGRTLKLVSPRGPEPGERAMVNPLARSALLLAGVEALGQGAQAPPDEDDGLMTALEVSGLNLWGTQLVVLSACDTGRGEVQLGQEVYGLRRAFFNAGAETLVTSLWKVSDGVTRDLMEAYYRNLLSGQGRSAALRQAALAVRAQHPHPYYWAPFIVLGKGDPLHGLPAKN